MLRRIARCAVVLSSLLLPAGLHAQTTASLTPTSYNFGNQVENTNSSPEVFTLKNTGAHQLTGISISVSGAFAQTHGCGTTLASGNSCTISVAFKPTGTGPFSGTLTVTDSATNSPQTAALSGTGVYPVTLNPISLTFNNQVVGTTSSTQTVTVKNNESSAVTISSIGTSGDFSETNTCPSSLGSLDTCTISVSFTPTATGTRTGTLSVTDSAPNNPSASLTGNGINTPIPATFFGMDINQNDVVYSPHNPHDYWPGTAGTNASGVSFGTYRTLGSAIKWNDLYDCTTSSYVFEGTGASSNALLSWGTEANQGGQAIMFTAYYTPDCLVPTAIQNSTGMSECAFITQKTVSGDHEYYGCDLPGDVGSGDGTFKTFLTDLLTYLTNTTYFPNTWPAIYVEVWNEPSNPSECYPAPNGNCTQQSLAQMVADAKSIAGTFPGHNIKIISPPVNGNRNGDCTLNGNAENINVYLSQLLAITSPSILSNADIIGFHGYSQIPTLSPPSTYDPAAGASCEASLISSVQSTILAATSTAIPVYDTESSWGTGGNAAIQGSSNSSQNAAEEAAFTGAFYLIHASNSVCSSSPCFGIDGVSWYGWDFDNQGTDPGSTGQFWDQWASPSGALTQAGSTYEILYSWLKGASSVGPCNLYQPVGSSTVVGVWTCQFEGPGTSAGLAVWDNSQSCLGISGDCPYTHSNWSFSSFGTYTEWRDLYTGAVTQLDGATTVNIGLVPILLDNGTEPTAPRKGQKAAGGSLSGRR